MNMKVMSELSPRRHLYGEMSPLLYGQLLSMRHFKSIVIRFQSIVLTSATIGGMVPPYAPVSWRKWRTNGEGRLSLKKQWLWRCAISRPVLSAVSTVTRLPCCVVALVVLRREAQGFRYKTGQDNITRVRFRVAEIGSERVNFW